MLHPILRIDIGRLLGEFQASINVPASNSLEHLETRLEGLDKKLFLKFVSKMLQWDPKNRQTPSLLLEDEWLNKHVDDAKSTTHVSDI